MQKYIEVRISDILHLMTDYIEGRIDVESYCSGIFTLMTRRMTLSNEESRILGSAFHDADDYDADVRLEYTILEPELRQRVANSIAELTSLANKDSRKSEGNS